MSINFEGKAGFNFLIGFFFINLVGLMLFTSALGFALNVPLSPAHFPVALLIALGVNYYASCKIYFVKDTGTFLKSVLLIGIFTALAFLLAGYFYDVSIDGQTYHQATIIALKNGWDPFYRELSDKADFGLWLNHYGKGAEIPQAIIYAFTNKIETGKATNIFLLIGAFFLTTSLLYRLKKFSKFKVYLIGLLTTLNPVVIVQLFSYYIDGQLALLLQCLFVMGIYLLAETNGFKLYLFALVIIILVNIKFTAIPYADIFVMGLLALLLYLKKGLLFKKIFITAAIASVTGVVFIGFNPYITNTINNGNPFYPLAGKGKIDIMHINSPVGFPENNRFKNFFTSVFSRTANMFYPQKDTPRLKMPFTFKMQEMRFSYEEDTRIGGFGVLFSGIILLSVVLSVITFRRLSRQQKAFLTFGSAIILVSVFIFEYGWWARYVPQLWLIPVMILAFAEIPGTGTVKVFRAITYIFVVLNISLLGAVSVFKNLIATQKTKYQLAQLQTLKDTVAVDFGLFKPSRLKFIENHIAFKEQKLDSTANFNMKYIHANVNLKNLPAKLPEPYLFKLDERLKNKSH